MSETISKTDTADGPDSFARAHGPAADAAPTRLPWQLDYLPIGLFASVMGLTGLSVAWRLAGVRYGAPAGIATGIGYGAMATFVLMTLGYAVKLVTAPQAVLAEFRHPVAGNLFGTFVISLLLLPILLAPIDLAVAQGVWIVGAIGMAGFAWLIVTRWMSDRQLVAHATPAWIIPVVGLLDVPLALPSLHLPPMHGVMVFGLAVGLFFAVPLFTLIFSRILFEPPMPPALQPALLILVAPPAVGFSTYFVTTGGQVDLFAESLYVLMLFLLAVLLPRLRHAALCCPFKVAWWAISFPLAASAITALRFASAQPGWVTDGVALVLLGVATLAIAGLAVRTLFGLVRGELRTLSV
jgi:tellurite resistance protein